MTHWQRHHLCKVPMLRAGWEQTLGLTVHAHCWALPYQPHTPHSAPRGGPPVPPHVSSHTGSIWELPVCSPPLAGSSAELRADVCTEQNTTLPLVFYEEHRHLLWVWQNSQGLRRSKSIGLRFHSQLPLFSSDSLSSLSLEMEKEKHSSCLMWR